MASTGERVDRRPVAGRRLVIINWRDRGHREAGGAEVVCEEIAHQLSTSGWDVTYLTSRDSGQPPEEMRGNVRYVRLGGRLSVYPRVLAWMLLHRDHIDAVIDSQNGIPFFSPLVVRKQAAVLLLMHHVHQDQFGMHLPPVAARLGRLLEGPISRLVYGDRSILAVSATTRQQVRQRLRFKGPIFVAPPGSHPVPATGGRSRSRRIVFVGRLVAHKRVELIIDCIPELVKRWPDLELHIVGDGPARPALQERASRLGLGGSVIFHGLVDEGTKHRLVRSAWVGVTASAFEGWCLSVIEANAVGVPMVGLRRPGVSDSIRHKETGWLADSDSELGATLQTALEDLSDSRIATRMTQAARAWASRFTWEEMASRAEAALLAEAGRRALGRADRRRRGDVATVARVPCVCRSVARLDQLRATDRVREHGDGGVSILLAGADTSEARLVLDRLLPGWQDAGVMISVAQPRDLVEMGAPADTVTMDPPFDRRNRDPRPA